MCGHDMFLQLPDDLHMAIMAQLGPAGATRLGQTCRQLRAVCSRLPTWQGVMEQLRVPPPRPRAWKRKTPFSVVVGAACCSCRCRRRLRPLPVCRGCVESTPQLGRLRSSSFALRRRIRRHEVDIFWAKQNVSNVAVMAPEFVDSYSRRLQELQAQLLLEVRANQMVLASYQVLLSRWWRAA